MERPAAVARLAALLQEKESRAAEVARLLHDDVGPTLSAIGFHVQAMRGDPQVSAEILGYLEQAIEGVRAASQKLHMNFVERSGLPMALDMLVNRMNQQHGMSIQLDVKSDRRFPPQIGHAVYRVVELALDNAHRHARAQRVEVSLTANADGLVAEVRDDGHGFDTEQVRLHPPGTGLILMESYAGTGSLQLRIASEPGKGTIIGIQTI